MNIKDYIESGIVATYVLGLASEAEQKEFESLCHQYPELVEAKNSFELRLENEIIEEAVPVPAVLKEKVLTSITNTDINKHGLENGYKMQVRKMNVLKMLLAACILLLTGSIYFAYYFRDKYQKLQKKDTELVRGSNQAADNNPILAIDPIVRKPSVKWAAMLEPKDSSHCMAHIYRDSVAAKIFLLVGNIPQPVSGKKFQLWALTNTRPINLGMFDISKQGQLLQMKNVQNAKTFVITIEQSGGSTAPSMEAVYAVGKL